MLMTEWSLKFNCYEAGHTWTPYCSEAALEICFIIFQESLKMYSFLNLLQYLLARRYNIHKLIGSFYNACNSSIFLGFNGFLMITLFCGLRKITGEFYYIPCALFPAFVSSFCAIFLERPSRRNALAVYLANIASECVYRLCVKYKFIKTPPFGEIILFTCSMSTLMFIFRTVGLGSDPISMIIKFLIGKDESKIHQIHKIRHNLSSSSSTKELSSSSNSSLSYISPYFFFSYFTSLFTLLSKLSLEPIFAFIKHSSCPHKNSCISYTLVGYLKPFSISLIALSLSNIARKPRYFLQKPMILWYSMKNMRTLKFSVFLGAYVAVFRSVNCILRHINNRSYDWHPFIAGLLAGPMMLISPNHTISTYVTWKCIEALYCLGSRKHLLPNEKYIVPTIYSLSVAIIFYTGVLEPNLLRPSYIKFIDTVSQHKLHRFNRPLLSLLGTGAEKGYEDFLPDLDFRYCSKYFLETNFLWLL